MNANLAVGRGPAHRWLILFVIVDVLIVLSIIGWVAARDEGSSAVQRATRDQARRAVMANTPQELAQAVLEASRAEQRSDALTALASRRGLTDEHLREFIAILVSALGESRVLEVSVTPLKDDELLEYERDGVRYEPNLEPEGRIRLHQADLTHTSVLFGRDQDGYRIAFAAPAR